MSDNDRFAYPATPEEWQENPLKVRDLELVVSTDPTAQSPRLSLTLKSPVHLGILERCEEDRRFLFEFDDGVLVAMACDILSKLDPVTNEQILARIRKLVEDQE